MKPPVEMMYDGPAEDWERNGLEFLGHYLAIANLMPDERMLDVGSGLGRKTVPLLSYLSDKGSYEGFDCTEVGVRWCEHHITPVRPNFKFQHVDVAAPGYNPNGKIPATKVVFPYKDNEFDLVVLGSVFTHMQYSVIRHYLIEINRVLKPGGRCFATWFIWEQYPEPPIFKHKHEFGWYSNPALIEEAICFDFTAVSILYAQAGLKVVDYHPGGWATGTGLSYQDIVLAVKGLK